MRIIKKYPNRRLYDTEESRYVTLSDIRRMILDKTDIKVIDKQHQTDITTTILIQVITEQEQSEDPILSRDLLLELIHAHDSGMQQLINCYLDQSLKLFIRQRQPLRNFFQEGIGIDPASTRDSVKENFQRWLNLQTNVCKYIMDSQNSQDIKENTDKGNIRHGLDPAADNFIMYIQL